MIDLNSASLFEIKSLVLNRATLQNIFAAIHYEDSLPKNTTYSNCEKNIIYELNIALTSGHANSVHKAIQ